MFAGIAAWFVLPLFQVLLSDVPVQICKNFSITGAPFQAIAHHVLHPDPVGLPDLRHRGVDPGAHRLRRCAVVPGHFGMEPHGRDLIGPLVDTQKHRVGQIKETAVICPESQPIQRIIDQGDQRFPFLKRGTLPTVQGLVQLLGGRWEGGAAS